MELRNQISTESWMEDITFAQIAFSQDRSAVDTEREMFSYLAQRYDERTAGSAFLVLQASHNWLVRNLEELREVGLYINNKTETGFVNALLFALHNMVFRNPTREWWEKVPSQPLAPVISEAQAFINADK